MSGWSLEGVGILPFDSGFSVYAKLGGLYALTNTTYTTTGGVAAPANPNPKSGRGKHGGGRHEGAVRRPAVQVLKHESVPSSRQRRPCAFGYASRMISAKKLALVPLIALGAVVAYWMYGDYQKGAQQKAIAGLVAEGTAQLRAAISGNPNAESVARIDATLQALRKTRASRQIAMAGAAEGYLVSARAIVLRKAEVARAVPQAAASRQALAAHMHAPRGRDDSWIRRASDLKRKMDQDYAELDRQLKTLADLVYTLPDAEKAIAPYVEKSLLLGEALQQAAFKQVEAETKRAAEEIDKAGRLPVGR
jgi:hypothetical protein